jgi:hypothetical protein
MREFDNIKPSWYKENPNKKYIKYAAIVLIIFFVYWFFLKDVIKRFFTNREVIETAAATEQQYVEAGEKANFSDSEYTAFARQIETALDGWTSDEEQQSIVSVISKMKNNVDWQRLIKAFGVRTFSSTMFGWGSTTHDLKGWLREDMKDKYIKAINDYFATININDTI